MVCLPPISIILDPMFVLTTAFSSFNCLLPAFTCGQYAECNTFNGQCSCPDGFGGADCIEPCTS